MYVLSPSNAQSIGDVLLYGICDIFVVGALVVVITMYIVYRNRSKSLHKKSELNQVIQCLIDLYEQSSK